MIRPQDFSPAVLEGEALVWVVLLALGIAGLIMSQPLGRPRPDLAARLRRLEVDARREEALVAAARAARPAPAGTALGALLRPIAEAAGGAILALLRRLGVRGGAELERDLAVLRPGVDPPAFYGEKLLVALAALLLFPLTNILSGGAFDWPLWVWLAGGWIGYLLPSSLLRRRARARRAQIVVELPAIIDLLTMCFSSGRAVDPSVRLVATERSGIVPDEFRRCLRDMVAHRDSTLLDELAAAAGRNGSPEFAALVRQLAEAYRVKPASIRRLIIQSPAEKLKSFADAFKIVKD
jgi:Flp pilus assembly protein TadB